MPTPIRRSPAHAQTPVFGLPAAAAARGIRLVRFPDAVESPDPGVHAHDHAALAYLERSGGSLRSGDLEWQLRAGDVFLVAPGEVYDSRGLRDAQGWGVFFAPELLGLATTASHFTWRAHPLLFSFVGASGRPRRLSVPEPERAWWMRHANDMRAELDAPGPGAREAAIAHLTLLVVAAARLAHAVVGEQPVRDDPVLRRVFEVIDECFEDQLSLSDVADAVGLTPAYLTTLVRRRTGRTVQSWILERRLAEARRLLARTDHSVAQIGAAVGFPDSSYFVRTFRREHGTTPLAWRRASSLP